MSSKIMVSYNEKYGKFYLRCPRDMSNFVRELPNRRYLKKRSLGDTPLWEAPALSRNAECIIKLHETGRAILEAGCEKILKEIQEKSSAVRKSEFVPGYRFKTTPFEHQRGALRATYGLDQSALYMEMGTGKSKIIIDSACCYFIEGTINSILIVCPVSIRTNWVNEFARHAPIEYNIMVCDPGSKKQERDLEEFVYSRSESKLKVFIVGTQSLSRRDSKLNKPIGKTWRLAEKFMLCHNAMMAVDEAHLIKNHDSNRSRNAVLLGLRAKKRMVATGTPIARGLMDLYMQFEFLSTHIVGIGDYYSFRNRYAVMGGFENKQIIGYDNTEELMDLIRPWTFQCTKEQVLPDLPDKLYSVRQVSLSKAQRELYTKVKKDRMAELPELNPDGSNVEVVAENILVMNLALQQIVSGFVTYDKEGVKDRQLSEVVGWSENPKIKELLAITEEHKGKPIIVWSRFRKELSNITAALESKYGEGCVAEYHGGVSKETRDFNEQEFKAGRKQFFVSNQATGGVGLTLNAANLSIYMSNDFNYIHRKQSEDRNHRIGQTNKVLYIDIVAEDTVDYAIIQSIENKQDMSDFVKLSLAKKPKESLQMLVPGV